MDNEKAIEFIDAMIDRRALKVVVKAEGFEAVVLFDPNRYTPKPEISKSSELQAREDPHDAEIAKYFNPTTEDLKKEGLI